MRSSPRILIAGFLVFALLAVLLLWPVRRTEAPVTITFVGFTNPAVFGAREPQDPWGVFIISNPTARPVKWSATTEAPLDPTLSMAWGFCSFWPHGTLSPFSSCEYHWPVPGKPGQPFRAVVSCELKIRTIDRLWHGFWRNMPLVARFWQPKPLRVPTVPAYSTWQVTPNQSGPANGSQPIRSESNPTPSAAGSRR